MHHAAGQGVSGRPLMIGRIARRVVINNRINQCHSQQPLPRCCGKFQAETGGAFDPGVGALVSAWGLRTQTPQRPPPDELASALEASGLGGLELDIEAGTATRRVPGLLIDPGASGKGWALDHAVHESRRVAQEQDPG